MNINDFNHEVDNSNERIRAEPTFASNQPTIAVSSMNQYKSAIIWHYKENMSKIDETIDSFLK